MPEIISCPDCDRKLRVPEDLLGKKVKCPGCGVTFTASAGGGGRAAPASGGRAAPSAGSKAPPSARSSPRAPRAEEGIEETPRAKKRPAMAPPEEDYEEEDDRGRGRGRGRARDEDDEEDDRGRGRGRGRARDEEEEEYEDEDVDEAPRTDARAGWQKVRLGITLIIVAIFVAIGGGILTSLLGMLAVGSMSIGMLYAVQIMGMLFNYSSMGLDVAGHGLNMSVPPRRGQSYKGLAIATFSLYAAWAGITLLSQVIGFALGLGLAGVGGPFGPFGGFGGGGPGIGMGTVQGLYFIGILSIIGLLCALAGWFCFMFLLRGIALMLGKPALAKTIVTYMITAVSFAVGSALIFCISALVFGMAMANMFGGGGMGPGNPRAAANAGAAGGILFLALGCIFLVCALALLVWYIVILFQVRGVVDSHLRRR
jgi:hypothetical protein